MAHIYATAEQYEGYTCSAAPADIEYRLARASEFLGRHAFRYCGYDVDDVGLPSHATVAAAFANAVSAQVQWGVEVGDVTGAFMAGYGSAEIGSAKLSRSVTSVSGADSPGRQVAPAVWDALQAPDLTPDIFRLGAVQS
jgi:hypothetical protein